MGLFSSLLGNAGVLPPEKLMDKFSRLLTDGEEILIGFTLIRDTFVFTNKRLILVDVQGLTGSKTEYKSVPYKAITRFSVESAGTFDLDAELKIWVSSEQEPGISKKFSKKTRSAFRKSCANC
tara:strand:+ start:432 stop:800 length:369 start_codon:yes stop_codon:yes gene_type:complete